MGPVSATLLVLAILVGVLFLLRLRSPRPDFPPLEVGNDDPAIAAAVAEAQQRIEELREHAEATPERCLVKFALTTSSGAVEHLWAELLEARWPRLRVRLVTPPVSHEGPLERVWTKDVEEIEDWQVTFEDGTILGGFTQRAMFVVARREWGELPKKLADIEKLYR